MGEKPIVQHFEHDARFFSNASVNCKEPIVFHYTGAPGALGIVQTGQLWCTLVHHMNDSSELKFALGRARSVAYRLAKDWPAEKRQRLMDELSLQYERVEHIHIFAACFSEGEDLLSQWRGYAGIGGYCIGFSLASLRTVARKQGFLVEDVLYKHEDQERVLDPIIGALIKDCSDHDLKKDNPGSLDSLLWKHTMNVVRVAPRIKHPSFSEEREWRIYSDPFIDHTEKYDYTIRSNEILPLIKLNLDNGTVHERGLNLRDICGRVFGVGPGPNQEERSAAYLSAVHRYNVYWRMGGRSSSPLR